MIGLPPFHGPSVPLESIAEPHLEGLLHLATLAFAMTLIYLGLDKVGDDARARLQGELEKKLEEIGKLFIRARFGMDEIINVREFNILSARVGDSKSRKALCMLLTLGGIGHDLYDGPMGAVRRRLHSAELFLAFRCFLLQWDVLIVGAMSVVGGCALFYLIIVATFHIGISQVMAVFALALDVSIILIVIWAAHHAAKTEATLLSKYTKWSIRYEEWLKNILAQMLAEAEEIVSKQIHPPEHETDVT